MVLQRDRDSGGEQSTLMLSNVQSSQAGRYSVIASNSAGAAIGSEVRLTVLPRPTGPGSLDVTFDPTAGLELPGITGAEASINAMVLQPDGKVVVAGSFVALNGYPRNNIARVLPDGTLEASFDPGYGIDGEVHCLALQADGKIVAGGRFSGANGTLRTNLARFNSDGSLDLSFVPGQDPRTAINALAIQADGKVLVGGSSGFNDPYPVCLSRLNSDGSPDSSFVARPDFGAYPSVQALALQPDGKILVGASLFANGTAIVRLHSDGTTDTNFVGETYGFGTVSVIAIALLPEGKIMIGGHLHPNGVARLNANGRLDPTFDPSTGHANSLVRTLTVQADGKVVVGGWFTEIGGGWRPGVARFETNGALDTNFLPQISVSRRPNINALLTMTNGNILIGAQGESRWNCLFAIQTNGNYVNGFTTTLQAHDGGLQAVALQADGRVLVSGYFDAVNGIWRNRLARLQRDGTLDPSFNISEDFWMEIRAMALQSDGKILLGGYANFSYAEDEYLPAGIVRLNADGSTDGTFHVPTFSGQWPLVDTLALQPDGKILVGGVFSEIDGVPNPMLVRLNPDGTVDPSLNPLPFRPGDDDATGYGVAAMAVLPDGKIYIGGGFTQTNLQSQPNHDGIARLFPDGTIDPGFTGFAEHWRRVRAIAVQPDGRVVIGGEFNEVNGLSKPGIARFNPDGSLDSTFMPEPISPPCVRAVYLQPDGKVLVGTEWMGTLENSGQLRRLNSDGSLDPAFRSYFGQGASIWTILGQPDGQLLVAGNFKSVNGLTVSSIVRINNDIRTPFVQRELPAVYASSIPFSVRLVATPAMHVNVYAVEEQPPAGWLVGAISHAGVFDSQIGKIKFGPFFDAEPRMLTYQLTPPANASGIAHFTGLASVDGSDTPVTGANELSPVSTHPADNTPGDWMMRMSEVTRYGAAWRTGQTWPLPPNPIPIAYVTRAAALWKGGERYTVEPTEYPPLCWIDVEFHSQVGPPAANLASAGYAAQSILPSQYVPAEPLTVWIETVPGTNVGGYAVEDQFPAGWSIVSVSQGGAVDLVSQKVKWGPFLDANPRTLAYQVVPPANARGLVAFNGTASFDGVNLAIAGARQITASSRLTVGPRNPDGITLSLGGEVGAKYSVENSTNLVDWNTVLVLTNTSGRVEFPALAPVNIGPRFYRALRLD